ncbi:MAG: GNAT family N-acetyltransferase [Nocardioidaceae bacterium]|nr:GNAT family N-acetyltransferase [Nocardioidaceae bacterium]
MLIRPVDLRSPDDLARYHAGYAQANEHGRRKPTTWSYPELVESLREPSTSERRELFVAEEAGDVVGIAELELPLRDNLHLAFMYVGVPPEHRRRGIGTALAARLRAGAEGGDRRLASAWIPGAQLDGDGLPAAFREVPGEAFARRLGMDLRNTDVHRVLPLPVDGNLLDALAELAAPHHGDYRIAGYVGPCPDEHVEAYCALKAAMVTEAPLGELEIEPEQWDEQRLREEERELERMGRTRSSVLALAPDGSVAGFNELLHAGHDVGNIYNWDTLVLPGHRGHRLGLALKVDNLCRLQRAYDDGRWLHTHNAAQNAPMVAVNDQIGFRPVERVGEWQGSLAGLPS